MLADDTYHAHVLRVGPTGKVSRHPAGRFMVRNGQLSVLEDYHNLIGQTIPEGAVDDLTVHKINAPGPHLSVASRREINEGRRLDFVPEHPLHNPLPDPPAVSQQAQAAPQMPQMPPIWHYHRAGHDKPHVLEGREGKLLLDGNPLQDDEVATILQNVRGRVAKLRYVKSGPPAAVVKMEELFTSLRKADGEWDPQEALAHLDKLHGTDEKTQGALAALRRHIFEDPMTGLGNKYAYSQWLQKPRPGVHLMLDANNFKQINDTVGHDAGDAAIKAFGGAIRESLREVAPPGLQGGKAHRFGGDEFHVHLPTFQHAASFARALHQRLAQVPPVGGVHPLSMSVGAGSDPQVADRALGHAKTQKMGHQPHTLPHLLFHSLVPGNEGAMTHGPSTAPPRTEASAAPPHPASPEGKVQPAV